MLEEEAHHRKVSHSPVREQQCCDNVAVLGAPVTEAPFSGG